MTIRKNCAAVFLSLPLLASGALAQQKAHEHGHWQMNAAAEGNLLLIEVIAPGADVAGFEHEARTASEKAKVWTATEKLKDGEALFALTPAAGCELESAEAGIAGLEGDSHDKEDKHGHEHKAEAGEQHAGKQEESHNEYHAEYRFACVDIEALQSIRVHIFKAFPDAASIEAAFLGSKGQRAGDLTPAAPVLDVGGLI